MGSKRDAYNELTRGAPKKTPQNCNYQLEIKWQTLVEFHENPDFIDF